MVPPDQTDNVGDVVPERRAVTVMFCDLAGSTAMSEVLDPEELLDVVTSYQQLCRERIETEGGHVAKYLGDGVLAFFGYPLANDDDPRRAVRAGRSIAASMGALSRQAGVELHTRIGIHTGAVVAGLLEPGTDEYSVIGTTPNIAARLQDFAEPDSVLVSIDTQRLCAGYFEWHDVGLLELKGIAEPLRALRPVGEREIRTSFDLAVERGLRPLVGRVAELDALRQAFDDADAGRGRIVRLVGEGGIGKSRLLHALGEELAGEGAVWVTGLCTRQTKNAAFTPVIEAGRAVLGLQPAASDADQVAALERAIDDADARRHLRSLLGVGVDTLEPSSVSPELARRRHMEALARLFVDASRRSTLVVTLEDLHWVDPSTLEFLGLLRPAVADARILLLLSTRPTERWAPLEGATDIELMPLAAEAARELVVAVSGSADLPDAVVERIARRADGVPLFVEELTKMVLESTADAGAVELSIPSSLEGSLRMRLDRLGDAKLVAQLAAVVGRDFDRATLDALGVFDADVLDRALDVLVAAELIERSGPEPSSRYTFRHALIQDAAYESLLKKSCRVYHGKIAECGEAGAWGTQVPPEVLAHHFSSAGMPARAIPNWLEAGRRAAERSANAEAIAYFRRGLDDLEALEVSDERRRHELALVMGLGPAFTASRGYGSTEALDSYTRALELCDELDGPPELFWVLWGLGAFNQASGRHAAALEKGRQNVALAEDRPELMPDALFGIGTSWFYLGDAVSALDALERGAESFLERADSNELSPTGHHAGVMTLGYLGIVQWHLGDLEQAEHRTRQAIEVAASIGHPFVIMHSRHWASSIATLAGDVDRAREHAEAELQVATEFGFPFGELGGGMTMGWLEAQGGDPGGVDRLAGLLEVYRAIGVRAGVTYYLALLADACLATGRLDDGLRFVADAFAEMSETGERAWESELYRLRALLRARDDAAAAEADLESAMAVARERGTLMLELRAALALAELLRDTPRAAAAEARVESIRSSLPGRPVTSPAATA